MKLQVFGILLGLIHVIYAVPTSTGSKLIPTTWDGQKRSVSGYESQPSYMDALQSFFESYIQQEDEEPSENFKKELQKYSEEHEGGQLATRVQQVEPKTEVEVQEVDEEPSESFKKELQEHFDEQVKVEGKSSDFIHQGDVVALQLSNRSQWLSCHRSQCGVRTCPGMYFMNRDWNNCRGEVFRIGRMDGPGNVTVGDFIGIQFPRENNRWLGCTGDVCTKSNCPGRPSNQNGFASQDHWIRCTGEVFRIYAKGKNEREPIKSDDDIMLYYVQTPNSWLSVGDTYAPGVSCPVGDRLALKASCPGDSRPPGQNTYDRCASEVFRIVKRA